MAAIVVAYLEHGGADVYQEVTVSGGVADIVARIGAEIWIFEVKQSLSLALVIQAMERRRLAHRVVIVAPYTRNANDVGMICKEVGIGLWIVRDSSVQLYHSRDLVEERIDSRRHNRRPVDLAARLKPEHKTHAKAGAVGAGGRWTPYLNTCEQLARLVREQPGITLKAAIDSIEHHYASKASARGSLATWIEKGKVAGVTMRRDEGTRLYPAVTP